MRPSFVCSVYALLLIAFSCFVTQSAWAALPTPNEPVLVVQNSASTDPYQNFIPELLTTEGINGFQTAQLADLTSSFLSNYDVVILPHFSLTSAQATLFSSYVSSGGTLVGFRPDLQLANVFGVASLGSTLSEAWLKIDTSTAYGAGLDGTVMRFHGAADRYSLNGATAMAMLYNTPTSSTASPAASIYTFVSGKAILFSFDLTQSIVLMRQGNPAWAGYPNNHDGYNTLRAAQMFMDKNSSQFWNDLGDGALNDIPQADIQLRLFSNAVLLTNSAKRPLPRFWYFPSNNRAVLLMTGDQHGDSVNNSISEINTVVSFGGKFSEFLWYPFGSISNSQVNTWISAGHAMGVHFDDTGETDSSGVGGSAASWNGMQNVLSNALSSFTQTYPSAPPPTTTRNHFLIWLSRNASGAADQIAQAKLFQNAGIEMDVTYTAFPNRWGYMTGSGLPMKFLDIPTGAIVSVYEQATQYEDDIQLGGAAYSTAWNLSTAQTHYQKSLGDSLNKYNTVVTMLFHPDAWSTYSSYAQTVLQYAQANSIPMLSTANWLQFWKSRVATAVSMPAFSLNTLTFSVANAPAGLTLLLPSSSGSNLLSTVSVDGTSQSFSVTTYQGLSDASVILTLGNHNISATYGPPAPTYTISGTITPSTTGSGSTVTLSGAASATATADSSGNYSFTGLLAGNYTVTPSKTGYSFSPTSRPVTLTNANVTGANFTISPIPTYTISGTISPSANGSGATVTLSGAASASTTADSSGNYSFSGLANGSYTVTPSKSGFTFSPTSAPATVNNGNLTALNFTATPVPTYSISGTISPAASGTGATVTLSGAANATATADASGNYTFTGLPNASYTVTPSKSGFTLSPASTPVTVSNANVTGINFTATANPVGQTVFTTQTPVTTNASDGSNVNYELGMAFTSTTTGQITAVRFWKTTSESGTHTGRIWSSTGTLLASVTFTGETASGWQQQALTTPLSIAANTNYVVSVNTGNSFYVATSSGLASQIANGNLRSVVGNNGLYGSTGQFPTNSYQSSNYFRDIVFVPGATYSISGTIGPAASGSGATVTLSGAASATATADATGNFSFTGLVNGSYTLTPSKSGFTFSPTSSPATVNNANVTGISFTATAVPTYAISGTISPSANGSGATVTLSGAASASTTADSSGNYSFSGLANGSYTVTPSKSGFTFSPTSAPATVNNGNLTALNFTATPVPTYSISGTISPAASGTGATVTLSGAANATATADASGNYTFTGLPNASYTVTPSKSGFTLSPASTPVTVSNANVTGINFTATANPVGQTVFTTQTPVTTNASDGSNVNYELGMAFTSTTTGQITAVRFWKTTSESGTHTGRIWSSTGTLLASVTFTGETASGWQQQALTTPLSIAANTNYVVSVNTGNSFYVATSSGLASQIANGNLRSVVGNNGLYGSTGQFPTNSYQSSNYFRDIVFVPGATYSISGTIGPAASGSGATVTLSGAASATATADATGNFSFTGLVNGSYTLTPSKSGFTFSPTSSPATVNNANVTGISFTATAVPTYAISGTISPSANGSGATVTLSGAASASTTADSSGNYSFSGLANGSYTVTPSKSGFTFSPTSAPATVNNANVLGINFTATVNVNQSVFTTQTPAVTNASDGSNVNYELGMSFTSTTTGQITAVRFWKATSETGTHTGRIWSSTGTLLASVTFSGETASGWQQQALTVPLSIAANATYVVSVNTGNSFYVATNNGLASQITNGNLSSVVGNNGLYGSPGQFPTNSWQSSNYFRDIVFVPGP